MKVRLKRGATEEDVHLGPWLRVHTVYIVISVEPYGSDRVGFRLVSENSKTPALFSAELFDVCDHRIPPSWRILGVYRGTLELGPEEFARQAFWEDFFDGEPKALASYREATERIFRESE